MGLGAFSKIKRIFMLSLLFISFIFLVSAAQDDNIVLDLNDTIDIINPENREEVTNILACGDTITTNTILTSDLLDCFEGLTFGANNIELNCQGHVIDGTGNFGVTAASKNSITVKNCIIKRFNYGISFQSSTSSRITNNTVMFSAVSGIVASGTGNNITDNYVTRTTGNLVYWIAAADNSVVINNIAFNNSGTGFFIYQTSNLLIINNTAVLNRQNGIHLQYSGSSNNIIIGNNVIDNTPNGILLEFGASNNIIYNNYFSNSNNARDTGFNKWNTSKTPGINIIGGPYLGGNFWSNYNGSDTNGDGLGDTLLPYNSGGNIASGGDYEPLVTPHVSCGDTITTNTVLTADLLNCTGNNENLNGNGLIFGANNIELNCQGHKISGTGTGFGVSATGKLNIIVRNCIILNFSSGLFLASSNNSILTNNTANSNSYGIFLSSSSNNNILSSNTANSNIWNGIWLDSSSGNTLQNIQASSNAYGLAIYSSSNNNTLQNIQASSNTWGLYLYFSNNNTLQNITASSNTWGLGLYSSNFNTVFNNYFNNTINAFDDGTNYWNITKTPGTNIIGGPYLGGNFWSDYAGTDNNNDGLGDTNIPYNSGGGIQNGGDYAPLVVLAQQNFSLYEPYKYLPSEKRETGILLDVGSILYTHLVQKANGTNPQVSSVCGDVNGNGGITLSDVIYLVNYIFNKPGFGTLPNPNGADVNGNGAITLSDVIFMVNYIFNKPGDWTPRCPSANISVNEELFLSADQFMEAYGDVLRFGCPCPALTGTLPLRFQNSSYQNLSNMAQNFTVDGIYPIALAAIKYNSIDRAAFSNGLLEVIYKNGTVLEPPNVTPEEEPEFEEINYIRETEQGQTNSYLNTGLFFGAGSMREMVYGDSSNLATFIIPSEFLITNGVNTVENISIRFIGLPKPNVPEDEFIPIYVDEIFTWNMSDADFFNETQDSDFLEDSVLLVANISFIIKAKVDGKDKYTAGQFKYSRNSLSGYQHCSPIEIRARYPISKFSIYKGPTWWPSTGYPGTDWNSKPSDPVVFFTGAKPTWWPSSIPWPTPLNSYGSGLNAVWMGMYEIIHDPQVWGPLYNSDTQAVGQGSEGDTNAAGIAVNWRGGFRTRLYITPLRPAGPSFDDCKAINLVVVVDGFDIKNKRTIDTVVGAFIGAIKPMLDKGYDVLVLDYNNNYEGGRDYLQRNGYALMDVLEDIDDIPSPYMKEGYEEHDAIVVGGSMGTQVSRYALAKAEDLSIDHNTGLWISVDGIFVGAHIPWSLQAFLRFFATYDISSEAEELRKGLDSHYSRQVLRRFTDLKLGDLSSYTKYYNEVNALNNGKGLPSKVRTVAIASGSGTGSGQTGGAPPGRQLAYVDEKTLGYGAVINAKTEYNGDENNPVFYGYLKKPAGYIYILVPPVPPCWSPFIEIPYGSSFKQEWTWNINAGSQDIDFSPGGYRISPQEAVDGYNKLLAPQCTKGLHKLMTSQFPIHSFVPTFSSLYYKGADCTTCPENSLDFKRVGGPNSVLSWSTTQKQTNLWYGPEDSNYPYNCGKSSCMDPLIEQKSPFDAIWYENANEQHVIVPGQKPPVGAYNVLFNEMDRFTSGEEFSSRLLGNSPKEPSHEVFLIGNISGCGQELLTINTFTEKAMVQRFVNNAWIIVWDEQVLNDDKIGGWNINKGDKFFLANIDDDKTSELISLSANVPAWAKVQKLVPNVPCNNNPTSYSWQETWSNNGNGYLGPWKIQYTDIYSFGNLKESGAEKLLVAYPYVGNNVRERHDPGAGGRSKASLLKFDSVNGWQEIWNNNNDENLHWIGNRSGSGGESRMRGCPIRFGDHLDFGKIFSRNVDALLCVNLIRDIFGSSFYYDQIVMQDFHLDNTWNLKWTSYTGFGSGMDSWVLGDPEDFFQFADLNGDGLDELFSVNTTTRMVHKFNTNTLSWEGLHYFDDVFTGQPGDRFYFGNIDNEPGEDVLILNPVTKGPVVIQRFTPFAFPGWMEIWVQDDGGLGNWGPLYEY